MKNIYITLLALLALLMLSSCSDLVSPERFEGETYSISGFLHVGAPIDTENPVFVCRSSSIDDFNYLELFVADATVKVFELTGTDTTKVLNLEAILDMDEESQNPMPKIKYIDPEAYQIKASLRYRIEVSIPGYEKLIWAETLVPQAAILNPDYFGVDDPVYGYSLDENTTKKMKVGQVDTEYPIALEMGDFTGQQYFLAEFFCREEFSTTDLEFVNPVFGIEHPDEAMRESYYMSGESIRRIQFMGQYMSQYQEDSQANYVMVRDYKQAYVFYGRYRVSAYVVDNNYYRYSFMPEGYLYGGVHNGLGYFGSASGGTMYTELVKGE